MVLQGYFRFQSLSTLSIVPPTNHVDIKTRSGETAADMARGRYRALAQHVERFRPGLRGELAIS